MGAVGPPPVSFCHTWSGTDRQSNPPSSAACATAATRAGKPRASPASGVKEPKWSPKRNGLRFIAVDLPRLTGRIDVESDAVKPRLQHSTSLRPDAHRAGLSG